MQKTVARERAADRERLIYFLAYSKKLAYLQLSTIFVYGSSSAMKKVT